MKIRVYLIYKIFTWNIWEQTHIIFFKSLDLPSWVFVFDVCDHFLNVSISSTHTFLKSYEQEVFSCIFPRRMSSSYTLTFPLPQY